MGHQALGNIWGQNLALCKTSMYQVIRSPEKAGQSLRSGKPREAGWLPRTPQWEGAGPEPFSQSVPGSSPYLLLIAKSLCCGRVGDTPDSTQCNSLRLTLPTAGMEHLPCVHLGSKESQGSRGAGDSL